MSDDVQRCTNTTLDEIIKELVCEFVVVIVKSGQGFECDSASISEQSQSSWSNNCCCHRGNLCPVGRDFILLSCGDRKTYIPTNAIAAIIKCD